MKKEELIAMVGDYSVHWWTLERIGFFISLPVVLLAGYANIVHNFLPGLTTPVFLFGSLVVLLCGLLSLFRGKKMSVISLKVTELGKKLRTVKVLGKDGKEHTVEIDYIEGNKDTPLTWVKVSGRLKESWAKLIIGSNISEIWEKEPKKK